MRFGAVKLFLRHRGGYSLIELLLVLAIFGIVAGIATPSAQKVGRGTRLTSGAQQLIGDMRLARTEAIRRNTSIYVARTGASTYHIQNIGDRTLPEGVTFASGPDTIRFAAFGPVLTGAAVYSLTVSGKTASVRVGPSGHASVP
jgi:prepilin-type N-terminal cleavage/methylation domain-containing protein